MFCEAYRETLKSAAAGAAADASAQSHLAACEACSTAFAEEKALLSAIESGLSEIANASVPPSLLPRVRHAIAQERVMRGPFWLGWVWAPSAAVVAMMLAAFLPRAFERPHGVNVPAIVVQPLPSGSGTKASTPQVHPSSSNTRSRASVRVPARVIKIMRTTAQPEVLVPPQEEEALLRYVKVLQRRRDLAQALIDGKNKKSAGIAPIEIAAIETPELRIEPLVKNTDDSTK